MVLKGHTGTVRAVKFRHFPSLDHVSDYAPPTDILLASCGAGDFRPRLWDVSSEVKKWNDLYGEFKKYFKKGKIVIK